ncbi:MAG: PSD1 and planctomycete cytochrome C domain-containing protein [Cyclobacteriaceae bacterium]|nr:PSD1 and planctomycete cytochrome C domain-containing protein [Cyclobacteriaceae bacterium]
MRSLRTKQILLAVATLITAALLVLLFLPSFQKPVDFNAQVRPILTQKCMKCHGGVHQQGGLSFLFPEQALDTLDSGLRAIVPHSPGQSAMIQRIQEKDPQIRMPLEAPALSTQEIKILKKWVKQGAPWEDHWAYQRPDPNIEPPNQNTAYTAAPYINKIDHFVIDGLHQENLQLAPEADKSTLLRRVSLDLIGMPPAESLAQGYLNNSSPQAYEQLVDALLASPHFGERWASLWLDLARYADSQGYQKDNLRPTMWMYRDWVIDALNRDMPFDQFTIEQLAGDLLPRPSEDQLLATAFHRNTMNNDEGGTDDEEFRVVAVLDRVNTTFEVWQGTTLSCVQCHTHPYDPIRHEEYYGVYAFFNNTVDRDLTSDEPNLPLLSRPQRERKEQLQAKMEQSRNQHDTLSQAYIETVKSLVSITPLMVPVMQELPADSSRQSFVFERGNWLVPGAEIQPQIPHALNPDPAGSQRDLSANRDRLALARWLVSPDNPLTARVMVNRFWEQLFGLGLVETLEDFGTQGAVPSHPDLLDWLAVQFSTHYQWSVKRLLKEMVLSATYRQSSVVSPDLLQKDPYNKLLARGPRVRLTAEQIRDQALMVSGLMNHQVHGPSVMPYQPEGVWNVIRHVGEWQTAADPKERHRRALYTFWRRVSPYPSLVTFDSPSREFCISRRIRTNTPLQALVTLNDPVYVEAAQALAGRMYRAHEKLEDRIIFAYRRALFRDPTSHEMETLKTLFNDALKTLPEDPVQLISNQENGDSQMFALIQVATVILNLDEMITKG